MAILLNLVKKYGDLYLGDEERTRLWRHDGCSLELAACLACNYLPRLGMSLFSQSRICLPYKHNMFELKPTPLGKLTKQAVQATCDHQCMH